MRRKLWKYLSKTVLLIVVAGTLLAVLNPKESDSSTEVGADPDFDQILGGDFDQVNDAFKSLGLHKTGGTFNVLRSGCNLRSYMVFSAETGPVYIARSPDGNLHSITGAEIDQKLHRLISFTGGFRGPTTTVGGSTFYLLGRTPGDPTGFVYIHFNSKACGLAVDKVMYTGDSGERNIPMDIALLPL